MPQNMWISGIQIEYIKIIIQVSIIFVATAFFTRIEVHNTIYIFKKKNWDQAMVTKVQDRYITHNVKKNTSILVEEYLVKPFETDFTKSV